MFPFELLPTPITRSSDLGLANDPLGYFLRRRLGLATAFSDSEAMNCGSWFHRAFHCDNPVVDMDAALKTKLDFLKGACEHTGASYHDVSELEYQDFNTACAWYEAASTVPFIDDANQFVGTFDEWIYRPGFKLLGVEVLVVAEDPVLEHLAVAQIDMLFYDEEKHVLRPLDIKTSADSPRLRFARCVIEPQVHHYTRICDWAMPQIIEHFDLPGDTAVDGMYHLGIQKPGIKFCAKDRDFEEKPHVLKSGPRKGETEMRKTYYGEPKLENFVVRGEDWYHGRGEYTDKKSEREADPPVNVSFTPFESLLSRTGMYRYWSKQAVELAVKSPPPDFKILDEFPPSPNAQWRETPFSPFYFLPPSAWEAIVYQEAFHVVDRDEDVPRTPGVKVLGKELPVL
jgi:hypothetical protein